LSITSASPPSITSASPPSITNEHHQRASPASITNASPAHKCMENLSNDRYTLLKTKGQPLEEGGNMHYMLASCSKGCPSPAHHHRASQMSITRASPPIITNEHHHRALARHSQSLLE
jgi:hypothetical protein